MPSILWPNTVQGIRHLPTVFTSPPAVLCPESVCLCRQAEKAAEIARDKYDEAKGQRELAEQKTAEHKRIEAEHFAIEQRLHDADAQLASMSSEVEQHVSALRETQAAREQHSGKLQEAEDEVERIARQLAEAQAVVEQLKQDVESIQVCPSPSKSCNEPHVA